MRLNVETTVLPGGVKVATAQMAGLESLAVGVWAAVGSRYEKARQGGLCHFLEHMLFKGSRQRSAREISKAIEGRGGYFNGFTQEESTCYYARLAAEHGGEALDILLDMYRHPRLDPADIEKERGVILEEILMCRDQPGQLVQDLLGELVWVAHPLGRPLLGTADTVRRITRQDLLSFQRRHYVPGNTLVVLAGKVRHDECVRRVSRALGRWPHQPLPSCQPVGRAIPQKDVAVQSKEIEQAHLVLAFRLFGRHDPRRYALKLASILLGENMSSRLFQAVREKRGLAYSIQSSVQLFDETGLLCVQAGMDPGRLPRALEVTLAEIARLRDRPVSASELQRAKDYARGQVHIGMESASNQMMWVGENLLSYGCVMQPDEAIGRLEAVTAEDVLSVLQQVISRRRLSTALVSPGEAVRHAEMIRQRVTRLG